MTRFLVFFLFLVSTNLSGQLNSRFAMAVSGFSSVTTVNDSTYTATLSLQSDQTGNGYLGNQVLPGWRVLTSAKKLYRIDQVISSSFSSAELRLVEVAPTDGAPSGTGVLYAYSTRDNYIPMLPVNTTGISSALAAIIQNHNIENAGQLEGDVTVQAVDSSVQLVYLPAHGLDATTYSGDLIAVKQSYALADASSLENVQVTYIVATPHPDSVQVKGSGQITRTAHGLAVGKVYYLTDVAGVYDTIPGTVTSPVFFVVDANTLDLLEQGAQSSLDIPRVSIPSPFITTYGGDPRSPSDSSIQGVAELFASIGRIRPGTVLVTQFSGSTANPTHQASGTPPVPSTPAHAWFWDGKQVTRMLYATTSFDLEATVYGTLSNIPLTPVVGNPPSNAQVQTWLTTNVAAGVSVPNGSLLYFVGTGNADDPDYVWMVVDDATSFGQIVKLIKSPAPAGDGYLPDALAAGSVSVIAASGDFSTGYGFDINEAEYYQFATHSSDEGEFAILFLNDAGGANEFQLYYQGTDQNGIFGDNTGTTIKGETALTFDTNDQPINFNQGKIFEEVIIRRGSDLERTGLPTVDAAFDKALIAGKYEFEAVIQYAASDTSGLEFGLAATNIGGGYVVTPDDPTALAAATNVTVLGVDSALSSEGETRRFLIYRGIIDVSASATVSIEWGVNDNVTQSGFAKLYADSLVRYKRIQ